jgi:hypothetical protein
MVPAPARRHLQLPANPHQPALRPTHTYASTP